MPQIVVAVAAAAASKIVGGAVAGAIGGTIGTVAGAVIGAVVASGVSFAGSAILGLDKTPKPKTQDASDRKQMVRSTVEPRQVVYGRCRVSGPLVYASSSGDKSQFLHLVIPLATHRCHWIPTVWINDVAVSHAQIDEAAPGDLRGIVGYGPMEAKVRIRRYYGDQLSGDPDLAAESLDGWTTAHALREITYLYVRLEYDQNKFPNGLQNISAEVLGKSTIFDPRTNTTGYSQNAALCILDYLRSPEGFACEDDEIDFDSFATAANICDEWVQIDAEGNTQPRYFLGYAFSLDKTPISIIEDMLAACGGTLTYVGGKYRLSVAAYEPPTDTLDSSDLAGPVEVVTAPARRERFNAVRGTYIDIARGFQPAEIATAQDEAAIAQDGEPIWRDIQLPAVNDAYLAHRLAYLALRRHRDGMTVRATVKYAGIRYCVWQTISVTLDDLGWSAKPFRIIEWSFDAQGGLVHLTLAEESPFSYAWAYDEANLLGYAQNTALVSPFDLPAPAGLAVTTEIAVRPDQLGVEERAIISFAPSPHPFVRYYAVERMLEGSSLWQEVATVQGEALMVQPDGRLRVAVRDTPPGLHEWRVRAASIYAFSPWSQVQARSGGALEMPPQAVPGLQGQAIAGLLYLSWSLHPDLDVRMGGRIEFRHTPETASPTWQASTTIGSAVPGDATFTLLPLKAGTYLAKAVDAGGRYSNTAASFSVSQATVIEFTPITSVTENPGFAGTKIGTVASGGTLRLDGLGDFDAQSDVDAIANVDGLGGVLGEGSYAFASLIDLVSVRPVRLTGRIAAVVSSEIDLVDSRDTSLDDWPSWDGVTGDEADAWIEVRQTDDNPAGSPTWSGWRRLDASEFRARAFQFRAQLRSYDAAMNIIVSELSVSADEVA